MENRSFRRARVLLLAGAAMVALVLAGCAPVGDTLPSPSPKVTKGENNPTPKPTITPALDTKAPAPRLSIPCDTLVPPSVVTGYQGRVTLVQTPALAAGDLADPNSLLPSADYIRQAGAIQCIWSTGAVDNYLAFEDPVPALLEVTVQFDAQTTWPIVAQDIGAVDGQGGECDTDGPGSVCQTENLVGAGTWISIYSRHATGAGSVGDVVDAAIAAVKAAGTPAALPKPQIGTPPLGSQCTDFLATTAVGSALGTSSALAVVVPDQGKADLDLQYWFASQNLLNDHPCYYSSGSTVQAKLAWIPGGAWAWAEDKTQTLANAPLQNLVLAGLHVHDAAWIRCASGDSSCVVDLVLNGNWIETSVPATSTAANKRIAVIALAKALIAKLG